MNRQLYATPEEISAALNPDTQQGLLNALMLISGRRYIPAPMAVLNGNMAERLRAAREHAGYSLSAAAKLMGMSKAQLWEIEAGRQTNPTLKTMLAFMRCYGLSADVFFTYNAELTGRVVADSEQQDRCKRSG